MAELHLAALQSKECESLSMMHMSVSNMSRGVAMAMDVYEIMFTHVCVILCVSICFDVHVFYVFFLNENGSCIV